MMSLKYFTVMTNVKTLDIILLETFLFIFYDRGEKNVTNKYNFKY